MLDVYIAGAGMTRFGKRPEPLSVLVREAAEMALRAAGQGAVEALYVGVMNAEQFTGDSNVASELVDALDLTGIPAVRLETASATGAAVFHAAAQAVAARVYQSVLVVAGEKMTDRPAPLVTGILAEVLDRDERLCGLSMPAAAALITLRYASEQRLTPEQLSKVLARIAVKNHANGALNPYAQFRQGLSEEHYLRSAFVADPLRLYDCAPISDGAAALVLTSTPRPVRVLGLGNGTDYVALRLRRSLTSFEATRRAAELAFRMARLTPAAIDLAEVHDAFTSFELIGCEDLGLFAPGEALKEMERGATELRGRLPVNPSGGLKARGHPVGASGLAQIVELTWQLEQSLPAERRVPRAECALAQSIGGLASNNFVTILGKSRAGPLAAAGRWSSAAPRAVADSAKGGAGANGARRSSGAPSQGGERPKARPRQEGIDAVGEVETFTISRRPPAGFPAPLVLAIVRDRFGRRAVARTRNNLPVRIGQQVYITTKGGVHELAPKSRLRRLGVLARRQYRRLRQRLPGGVRRAASDDAAGRAA
ncbi:MAG: thiolase family protein [Candidatus Tectomicrobia bacterium]|nr:thiolase family protein [Candidatus Tectomicrobia bacterium]